MVPEGVPPDAFGAAVVTIRRVARSATPKRAWAAPPTGASSP